ncbi:MAG TPA: CBS domain-containing protein [Labilithrix sp.]|nr:CBS domain-containing protein [Labilithrix sp.]
MTTTKNRAADHALAKLEAAVEAAQRPIPRVRDVMIKDVATCVATDLLERCAQLMWERACGSLPVIDDDGRPIAMITDRDVCMAAYTQGKPLSGMNVASAMSRRIFTARHDDDIAAAERIMRLHGLRRLPVVDAQGRLVGLISISDIAASGRLGSTLGRDGLSVQAIATTVAALGRVAPKER